MLGLQRVLLAPKPWKCADRPPWVFLKTRARFYFWFDTACQTQRLWCLSSAVYIEEQFKKQIDTRKHLVWLTPKSLWIKASTHKCSAHMKENILHWIICIWMECFLKYRAMRWNRKSARINCCDRNCWDLEMHFSSKNNKYLDSHIYVKCC